MDNSSAKTLPREILPSTFGPRASLSSAIPNRAIAALECPKCGKHTIVKRSGDRFDCLNCNFQKSLPPIAHFPNESAHLARASRTASRLHWLQQKAARAATEQQYAPYQEDSIKISPLLFVAIAVIFGLILL